MIEHTPKFSKYFIKSNIDKHRPDDVIKLVRLKPTTNNLINLAVLDEENICKISDFVNYVKNIEVLSDDITNKLETLNNLLVSRDYDINN